MSTRLDGLAIDEVSGVDAPANELPGWMVLKSADGAAAAESQLVSLYATLGAASVLDEAPPEILQARETLTKGLEELLAPEPEEKASLVDKMKRLFGPVDKAGKKGKVPPQFLDAEDKTDDADDEDTEDSSGKQVAKAEVEETKPELDLEDVVKMEDFEVIKDAMSEMCDRIENIEDALTGSTGIQGQDETITKGAPTLRDAILSAALGNRVTIR